MLHLVDHDKTAQILQRRHGLGELRFDLWILEIEVVDRILCQQGAGERRLSHLTRPDEGDGRAARQRLFDLPPQQLAIQHGRILP